MEEEGGRYASGVRNEWILCAWAIRTRPSTNFHYAGSIDTKALVEAGILS